MIVTSIAWIGIGVGGYYFIYTEPPTFQIDVVHPENVELGEEFEIKISVENSGEKKAQLANIDLYDGLMDGFEILDVNPKPKSSERIIGYHSYNYLKSLSPGAVHELTIKLRAKEVGYWSDDIDACNAMQNMVTHYTEIEVLDPTATEAEPSE